MLVDENPVPFEVILADNGSTDDSAAIARSYADRLDLRSHLPGDTELVEAVEVFLAGAPVEQFQLTLDQRLPHRVLGVGVMNMPLRVRFAGYVVGGLHRFSWAAWASCCCPHSNAKACRRGEALWRNVACARYCAVRNT